MSNLSKRLITAEDLYLFQLISSPRISPDGKFVVYVQHRIDQKNEKKYANLWIATTDGSVPPRQFTFGDQMDTVPRWSPDGAQIAFLSNRGDREKPPQIYLISMAGGEARPLTSLQGSIHVFSWSPDGRKLLCEAQKTDPDVIEIEKDEQKKKLGIVSRRYNRLFYKLDGVGYLAKERQHLWLVDVHDGQMQQITDHIIYDERDAAWSPDGRMLVLVSNRTPDPDAEPDRDDLFLLPASGGEVVCLATPQGSKAHPSFSPDGQWIAYYAQEGVGISYKNQNLWVVPVDGSVPARNLTGPYDLHAHPWTLNDMGQPEVMPPVWSPDSQRLYFASVFHGSTLLHSISVDGSDLQTLIGEGGVVGSQSFSWQGDCMAYFWGQMNDPGQVWVKTLSSGQLRKITQVNHPMLAELDLGSVEEVWFKGPDENDLQGWILKPPGFDPTKKYPSILEIHGGPLAQYGNFFMHEFYYFASKGFVVYFSNPRGGRGYGENHAGAIHGAWGDRDYADLMAWADYVQALPYIDSERMGVTGGSYGGYMTVWIIGHTNRFRAAVTQRCVSNFVSMWGSSDFNWTFQELIGDGKQAPYENLELFWDRSPIKYIGAARTPTLVIHNENDHRCPIEQGEQVYVALKRLGVESEFVRFPEEFHGLSRSGRTDRRIVRLNAILGWFERYLKGR